MKILNNVKKTGSEWRIYRKDYLHDESGRISETLVKSIWDDSQYGNDAGRSAIKDLFGRAVMDFPKSPRRSRILRCFATVDSRTITLLSMPSKYSKHTRPRPKG
ncbi:MAG: hypothetical protein FWH28_05645, partial [Clostridiales bacterium]|nr:hypothetical protein [Clostridiales bacterium]